MCGRFTLTAPGPRVAAAFGVPDPPAEMPPRYNVAPTQVIAVVGLKPDGVRRGLARLRWGLVPHWANTPTDGHRLVNVRSETARSKFGSILADNRCLIPTDGFYEWRAEG
jgi:putative SOS response-associated peptidase YedK